MGGRRRGRLDGTGSTKHNIPEPRLATTMPYVLNAYEGLGANGSTAPPTGALCEVGGRLIPASPQNARASLFESLRAGAADCPADDHISG